MNYVPFPKLSDSTATIAQALTTLSTFANQNNLNNNLYDPFTNNELTMPQETFLATLEGIDKTAVSMINNFSAVESYAASTARQALQESFINAGENFFGYNVDPATGKNISLLNNVVDTNTEIAETAANNARALTPLQMFGNIANAFNVAMRVGIVLDAPPDQQGRVAFEQSYEFVLEGAADLGVTAGLEAYTSGLGTLALIPTLVATNLTVGHYAQQAGDDAYNDLEQTISSVRPSL